MKRLSLSILGFALFASVAVSPALAQQSRRGFWFNGGLGYGTLGCENCGSRTGSVSGGLALGTTLSAKWLLGVGSAGWTKSENGGTLTVAMLDLRTRFYPSATGGFFLTGGIGVGTVSVGVSGFGGSLSASQTGVSALLGLGYDIRMGPNVSLTPFWNGFGVQTEDTSSNVGQIGVGITIH